MYELFRRPQVAFSVRLSTHIRLENLPRFGINIFPKLFVTLLMCVVDVRLSSRHRSMRHQNNNLRNVSVVVTHLYLQIHTQRLSARDHCCGKHE